MGLWADILAFLVGWTWFLGCWLSFVTDPGSNRGVYAISSSVPLLLGVARLFYLTSKNQDELSLIRQEETFLPIRVVWILELVGFVSWFICCSWKAIKRAIQVYWPGGDVQMDTIPSNVQSFSKFIHDHPQWNGGPDSYVWPMARRFYNGFWPQQVQQSGNCYLKAVFLVLHFVISLTNHARAGIVNIAVWIRQQPWKFIWRRIMYDEGGSSSQVLNDFLETRGLLPVASKHYARIRRKLRKHGPMLVANFKVYELFPGPQWSYNETTNLGRLVGKHAMVLIGVRRDHNSVTWLLLQNWWRNKQFVEVSVDYCRACGGTIWAVEH
jgi:hypothetical protein